MDNQPQQPISQPENNPLPSQNPVNIQPNVVVESNTQSNGAPHIPYQMTNPIAEPALGIAPKHKSKKPLMLLCLILILALIGGGAYALVGQKTSYQSVVTKFITAVQTKNKTAVSSLESPAFQAELKSTVGTTNFEIYCSSLGQFCTAYFSNSFINKSVITYKSYSSSSGIRGKEVVYTAKYASEGSKGGNLNCSNNGSTSTLTIAAIPKGNSWLIDYVNPSASSSTITCKPSGSTSTSTSTKTSTTTQVTSSPYAGWNTYTLPKEKLTFRYPTAWTAASNLTDSSNDGVMLSSSSDSNFEMLIGAGPAVSALDNYDGNCVNQADTVTFNNQAAYLDLVGFANTSAVPPSCTPASSTIQEVILSESSTSADYSNFFPTRNISSSKVVVELDYFGPNGSNNTTSNDKTISYIENDTDYKDAELIVNSMSY